MTYTPTSKRPRQLQPSPGGPYLLVHLVQELVQVSLACVELHEGCTWISLWHSATNQTVVSHWG